MVSLIIMMVPDGFLMVPDGFLMVLDGSFGVLDVPDGFLDIPDEFLDVPDGFFDVPEGFLDVPDLKNPSLAHDLKMLHSGYRHTHKQTDTSIYQYRRNQIEMAP